MEMILGLGRMYFGGAKRVMLRRNLLDAQAEPPPSGNPMHRHTVSPNSRSSAEHVGRADDQRADFDGR